MTTKDLATKRLPVFDLVRCKQCGICAHFCPKDCIAFNDEGDPYLARPEACTSCRMCEYMCPDWAVCLEAPSEGQPDTEAA